MKPCVAMLTFSETRDEFYQKRKAIVAEEINKVSQALSPLFALEVYPEIRSRAQALYYLNQAKALRPDVYLLHLPIWSEPQLAISGARLADAPVLLLGNERLETSRLVVTLARKNQGPDQNAGLCRRATGGRERSHRDDPDGHRRSGQGQYLAVGQLCSQNGRLFHALFIP